MNILKVREKLVNASCDLERSILQRSSDDYLTNNQMSTVHLYINMLWSEVVHRTLPIKNQPSSVQYSIDDANEYIHTWGKHPFFPSNYNIHVDRVMKLGFACVNLIDALYIESYKLHPLEYHHLSLCKHSFDEVILAVKGAEFQETLYRTMAKNLNVFKAFKDLAEIDIMHLTDVHILRSSTSYNVESTESRLGYDNLPQI